MRGYGLSDKPTGIPNYKLDLMVEDLRMLVEHLSTYTQNTTKIPESVPLYFYCFDNDDFFFDNK